MKQVYINANVYTCENGFCEAFIVENDKFIFTGTTEECKSQAEESDEIIDLNGQFVSAGFNDSHMHVLNFGQALSVADLSKHTESLSDMISYLKDYEANANLPDGAWLMGRGWNQDYFCDADRMPTREDLDKVSTDRPIAIVRCCGHALVTNTKLLDICGITAETEIPDGGDIGMENGVPNGRFFDNAMSYVYSNVPAKTKEEIKNDLRKASKALNSFGVTSAQTDDYCVFANVPWQVINEAYQELIENNELTVRIYEQSNFETVTELTEFVEAGNVTGTGNNMFKIGPLKMLGDGALGARTAYMTKPYADDSTTRGLPVFTKEVMESLISYANKNNMQIAVHSIGDGCLDMLLDSYEKALSECPRENHRHGVVHCQITRPDQLKRIEQLGLHVYAQSIFLDYDIHIVEERVGKELASTSYSWKTLMNNGVTVSNGSDCPVELPDCLKSMQCAVTRTTVKDNIGPYLPNEAFTVKEALDSYTSVSAYASFEENEKGQIKSGMLADFVVLDKSPFDVNLNEIHNIKVTSTYLGGKKVFSI